MKRFTPTVVTVRADTEDGWKLLCKEFRPFAGRPLLQPKTPYVAVFGQIAPDRLGWPVYVPAEDETAILRHKAEKLAEARRFAATYGDDADCPAEA